MKQITEKDFDNEVKEGVVLVDFSASWCGPCKMLAPVLEELSGDVASQAKIFKVDIDDSAQLASDFKIASVPTMIVFKDGTPVDKMIGFNPKEAVKEMLEKHF